MSAINVKENSQPSKVGKIEKSYLGSQKRKSPNQRRYSEVRSREHRISFFSTFALKFEFMPKVQAPRQ